jgi:hypothetical protein
MNALRGFYAVAKAMFVFGGSAIIKIEYRHHLGAIDAAVQIKNESGRGVEIRSWEPNGHQPLACDQSQDFADLCKEFGIDSRYDQGEGW